MSATSTFHIAMARRCAPDRIYVAIKHTVLALDRSTGAELWRTKLEKIRFRTNDFVGLVLEGDDLFASCGGELFCLDAHTGTPRWRNRLPKLGTGVMSIVAQPAAGEAPTTSPSPTVAEVLRQSAQQRSAAAG